MNKLIRLGKTGIEYGDYAWNFMSGCRHKEMNIDVIDINGRAYPGLSHPAKCPPVPCWAGEFVKRFPKVYPDGFAPHIYPEAFLSPLALPRNSLAARNRGENARVLVNFMGDMFGDWVDPNQYFYKDCIPLTCFMNYKFRDMIFAVIEHCPHLTFVFLTKNPKGMQAWGTFPDNCEVGFSAWSPDSFVAGLREISKVDAKVKWCSLEPLLDWDTAMAGNAWELLDWVAIGALTGTKGQIMELAPKYPVLTPWKLSAKGNRWGLMPPVAWLKNIVEACDKAKTKVFLKDNLWTWLNEIPYDDLYWEYISNLRQECGAREANHD